MLSTQNSLVKQAKANEPQAFQSWNNKMNTTPEGMNTEVDKSRQLKSKNFNYQPNPKLLAIQRMAEASDQKKNTNIQLKKNNSGLPDTLKSGVESLSGLSMDDVKVHYNSDKPAQLNAHAYAQGTDIHLASGQEKHLAHEAWHVVQQKQGRVQPTMMMKAKVPINDDKGLEKEADIMGARALQMKPFSLSDYRTEKSVQRKGIIQKVDGEQSEALNEHLDLETPGEEEVEFNIMSTINTLYHTTTRAGADKSILQRIDPAFFKSSSRFGGGFYLTNDIATSEAEIAHHKLDDPDNPLNAYVTISYNISGGKILDATGPAIYKTVEENPIHLRRMAQRGGMDGIAIPSLRGSGTNVVLFKNFGILKEGKQIQHRLPDKDIKRLPDGQPDMKKNGEFKETL
jgi:hypothetical protein